MTNRNPSKAERRDHNLTLARLFPETARCRAACRAMADGSGSDHSDADW